LDEDPLIVADEDLLREFEVQELERKKIEEENLKVQNEERRKNEDERLKKFVMSKSKFNTTDETTHIFRTATKGSTASTPMTTTTTSTKRKKNQSLPLPQQQEDKNEPVSKKSKNDNNKNHPTSLLSFSLDNDVEV